MSEAAPVSQPIEAEAGPSLARSAGIIALGNVGSRTLGLVREMVIAGLFGSRGELSAFELASRIPTMTYDLLVGGMLSAALVPVFSQYAARHQRDELWRAVSVIFSLMVVVLGGIVLLLEIGALTAARLMGEGLGPDLLAVMARLVRLVAPAILFFGLSGVTTGLLYSLKRFTLPAFATAAYNLGIIVAAPLLAGRLDIYSLGVGVFLGSLFQLLLQVPGLRGGRIRFSLNLSHPALGQILRLYLPVALGVGIANAQVAVDGRLASFAGENVAAWMRQATRLIQFPHGLVAVAVSMAALPSLARSSAVRAEAAFRRTFGRGLRMVLALIVPAAVGLWVLAEPAVALVFQHGDFTALDTTWVSLALRGYLIGLIFAAVDWPLNYAFYARQDTLTPNLVGVLSVGAYLAVALSWVKPYGILGLVLADSAKHLTHVLAMLVLSQRRMGGLRGLGIGTTLLKAAAASALMGLVVRALGDRIGLAVGGGGKAAWLAVVGGAGGVGLLTYLALGWAMRMEALSMVWDALRRRMVRSGPDLTK
jgi:putative peptidoglycan lipid II flippase